MVIPDEEGELFSTLNGVPGTGVRSPGGDFHRSEKEPEYMTVTNKIITMKIAIIRKINTS